jgi:hypothetical protein
MENQTTNPPVPPKPGKEDEKKKIIQRSASYPSLTLEEAYVFAKKIYDKFTAENVATREEIASALEVVEISRDVAACVQYGWLNKSEKGYQITESFSNLLRFESEKERLLLFLQAFGRPKLNQELINRFDGLLIPEELANSLVRNHSIAPNASQTAADIFMKSGKFVKAIKEDRKLVYKVTLSVVEKTQYTNAVPVDEIETDNTPPVNPSDNPSTSMIFTGSSSVFPKPEDKKLPIYMTDDKTSWFVYPPNMTMDDIALVEHSVKGILLRLEIEAKKLQKKP